MSKMQHSMYQFHQIVSNFHQHAFSKSLFNILLRVCSCKIIFLDIPKRVFLSILVVFLNSKYTFDYPCYSSLCSVSRIKSQPNSIIQIMWGERQTF